MPSKVRPLLLAAAGSAVLLAARLSPLPALLDAVTGLPAPGVRLDLPLSHLLLTPWCALADAVTCNSARQHVAFSAWILIGWVLLRYGVLAHGWREWGATGPALRLLAATLGLLAAFLAWVALGPRPQARLAADDPDALVLDLHSHTAHSWDGRRGFTPERNSAWHEAAGFHAAFITDHNTVSGARQAKSLSRLLSERGRGSYAALDGEEVSLHDAHVLALGLRAPVDPAEYADGPPGLERFLRQARTRHGALAVMSLPEYAARHDPRRWEDFARWGAEGFEILTASPRGLDVSPELRARAADLCRRRNLFVAAASDNHGWARSACAWNLLRIPGWRGLSAQDLERRVVSELRERGFAAVTVVARTRVEPVSGDWIWLDAPRAVWVAARTWTWAQTLAALAWLWGLMGLAAWRLCRPFPGN